MEDSELVLVIAATMCGGKAGLEAGEADTPLKSPSTGEAPPLNTREFRREVEGSTGDGSRDKVSVAGVSAPRIVTVLLRESVGDDVDSNSDVDSRSDFDPCDCS